VQGFIAPFERTWEHSKHKGSEENSLPEAAVNETSSIFVHIT